MFCVQHSRYALLGVKSNLGEKILKKGLLLSKMLFPAPSLIEKDILIQKGRENNLPTSTTDRIFS